MASKNTLEILITASDAASGVIGGMAKSIESSMKSAAKSMMIAGAGLTAATAPFIAGFATAVNAAVDFDESMTNVGAVLGKSKDEMATLNAEVLALGAASRAGPQAASEAFYDIVGGVTDASTHMAILEAAIATAEAGSADLGGTTNALISIMNSYGFSAEEAAFASDVLTQTVGAGVGSMEEFAAAMPQVAGLASSLGISFDSLGAGMAFLTTKGFSASQSATQLRAMMVAMLNPNANMVTALEEAGFASGEAAIAQYGLVGAFQQLSNESTTFQNNMAGSVGSVEALNGVIALTDESFAQFEKDFVASAEGATDAARKIQLDSFAAQMDILNSSVEALKIQIGLALLPVLTRMVRAITPIVQSLIDWARNNQPLIETIAKVVAGIAAFGATLTIAGAALGLVTTLIGGLSLPLATVLTAVMLLGYAIKENFLGLGDIFKSITDGLKDFAGDITNAFKTGGFEAVGQLILDKITAGLGAVATWATANIITPIKNAFDEGGMEGVGTLVLDALKPAIDTVAPWVTDNIITPITNALETVDWSAIPGQLDSILEMLLSTAASINDFIADTITTPIVTALSAVDWESLISGALDAIMGALLTGATSIADWLTEKIWTPLQTGLEDSTSVQNVATSAGEITKSILEGMASGLGSVASWIKTNVINAIINSLSGGGGDERGGGGVKESALSMGLSILEGIGTAFLNLATWVLDNIITPFILGLTGEDNLATVKENAVVIATNVLDGIINGLGDLPSFVLNEIITPLGSAIVEKAPELLASAVEIGKQILQGIIDGLAGIGQAIVDKINSEISGIDVSGALTGNVEVGGHNVNPLSLLRARGGTVAAGAPYVVGEKGPELFVPTRSGTIIPNNQLTASGGGHSAGGAFYDFSGAQIYTQATNGRDLLNELEDEAKRRGKTLLTPRGVSP